MPLPLRRSIVLALFALLALPAAAQAAGVAPAFDLSSPSGSPMVGPPPEDLAYLG